MLLLLHNFRTVQNYLNYYLKIKMYNITTGTHIIHAHTIVSIELYRSGQYL